MKCEMSERDQRIDDFLLEKLSPEDAEAFEIHLFGCPECLEELRLREQMVKLIKEERVTAVEDYARQPPSPQPSGVLKSIVEFFRFRQNIWIYAGAAAVLLIAFLTTQTLLKKDAPETGAANFAESPYLESIMQQTYRAAKVSVNILAPGQGENFTGEIPFRWEIRKAEKDSSRSLVLRILNNRQETVHETIITGNEYRLAKGLLASGLYYWTIEEQGNTLHLGKFFVNKPGH